MTTKTNAPTVRENGEGATNERAAHGNDSNSRATLPSIAEPEALTFLRLLYPDHAAPGVLNLWSKRPGEDTKRSDWHGLNNLAAAAQQGRALALDGWDVYFGVAPRVPSLRGTSKRGSEQDTTGIPGFWCDVDIAGPNHHDAGLPPDTAAARRLLEDFPEPSIIVQSGGGWHVYWLFRDYWTFHTPEDRAEAKAACTRLADTLTAAALRHGWTFDAGPTKDLARVLRLPGTLNRKRDPAPVQIIHQSEHRYTPGDFARIVTPPPALLNGNGKHPAPAVVEQATAPDTDEAVAWAVKNALTRSNGGRNNAGFWLGCQLRDIGLDREDAEAPARTYFDSLTEPDGFGWNEVTHALDQAFTREPRDYPITPGAKGGRPHLAPEALYGVMGEAARLIDPHTEADMPAVFFSLLTAFGNLAGRDGFHLIYPHKHHATIFVMTVGESGEGKKGTSWDAARVFVGGLDEETGYWKRSGHGGLASGEALIKEVQDETTKRKEIRGTKGENKGRFIEWEEYPAGDGVEDKRLLLVESEFAALLRKKKGETSVITQIICKAWDTGNLKSRSLANPLTATDAHISIIGQITPAAFLRELDSEDVFNGFANRFLYCWSYSEKVIAHPAPPPEDAVNTIRERITAALQFAQQAREYRLDQDAYDLWTEMARELAGRRDGSEVMKAMRVRSRPYIRRLAMIFAALDCTDLITPEHLQAAYYVWQYSEDTVAFLFHGRKQEKSEELDERIIGIIEERAAEGRDTTRSDITRGLHGHVKGEELDAARDRLIDARRIEVAAEDGAGTKKREVWRVVA